MDATGPLEAAAALHEQLAMATARADWARARRDAAVRAAISGDAEHEPVTMYAIAKRLDIPEQSVRRIRDRAPSREEILSSEAVSWRAADGAVPELHRQQGETRA